VSTSYDSPTGPARRYVITGGPSAGKEAIFEAITAAGLPATEGEPAREIYRRHRERLGRHLEVGDRRDYSREVLQAFVDKDREIHRVHELIVQGYFDAGYEPVFVPASDATDRLDFLRANLRLPM
jgi:predicted ATPase